MSSYFAVFTPDPSRSGIYNVFFPDLPGCVTAGAGLEHALKQACDALTGYLEIEIDRGEAIPEPSGLDEAATKAREEAKSLNLSLTREARIQLVCAEPGFAAPEPITIWMPPGLFRNVRQLAREEGVSISQLMTIAAREYLKTRNAEKHRQSQ